MAVKNQKSALMALAAAGGMWAWQNRDKIRGWMNSQRSQMGSGSYTSQTRRIGSHYPEAETNDYTGDIPAPRKYDAQI
ncbi:MAG: hypothetical protein RLZZ387_5283 [Chloroflexota bacterium]|jgi:hypothetical protein